MPFMLILVGLVLVITGIQNTYAALGAQLQKDLFGSKGFLVWTVAIFAVGLLGYVQGWEKFSRYFLALILIAIILANSKGQTSGGFFGNLLNQLKNPVAPPATNSTSTAVPFPSSNGQSGDANPMNLGAFGQSSQGWLGDQSRANNALNSITKFLLGGYSQ